MFLCCNHLEIQSIEIFCLLGLSEVGETKKFSNATFGSPV